MQPVGLLQCLKQPITSPGLNHTKQAHHLPFCFYNMVVLNFTAAHIPFVLKLCSWTHTKYCLSMMFVNPCIIVQFIKKNPTRCNNVSKFYSIFMWSSTCFGRHTAHHQEPKTALAASSFSYVEDCWMWIQQPSTYEKPEAASAVLGSWWWAVCRPKHVELHINME